MGNLFHATLLAASLALQAAPAGAACTLTQAEIPVRIVDHRPVATLKLNGVEAPMLLDSGAFYSMLSASTAAQLHLPLRNLPFGFTIEGYTGSIEARRTRVDKVGLLGTELNNIEFLVGGNELGSGIMGVLGRNILAAADAEYDLAHGVVRLMFPNSDCREANLAYWAGDAPVVVVPLDRGRDRTDTAIRIDVSLNGKRSQALMDTGAPQTALTLKAARRAGVDEQRLQSRGYTGGGGEGKARSWIGVIDSFELGGEKITHSRLKIDDIGQAHQDMVLGLDYFLSHRILVSRLQQQVYITWNGNTVFALNRAAGAEITREEAARYAAIPQELPQHDADALARRGAAALAAGNPQRALDDLNRACELAPGVADNFATRAQVHLALRRPDAALADLDQALRLNPTLADARLRRAQVRARLRDRAGALEDLAQLDVSLPPSAQQRADMAQGYAGFDQSAEALRQYGLWVGSHPSDARLASVLNERCWLRARLNIELPLALQDCNDAIAKDKNEAAYRDSLGWTQLRLGEPVQARKAFDRALELRPDLALSLYGRALALQRLNEAAGADTDLAAARKLNPQIDQAVRQAGFDAAAR